MTKRKNNRPRFVPLEYSRGRNWLIIGCILTLAGIPIFCLAFYDYSNASPAAKWPATRGIIQHSRIGTSVDSSGRLGMTTSYHADVGFHYEVNGVRHFSNKVHLGMGSAFKADAKALTERFRPGSNVEVYYDPINPHIAVLDPKVQGQNYWALIICGACLLLGLFFLYVFKTIRHKELWS